MRTLLVLLTLATAIWYGWQQYNRPADAASQSLPVPTQPLTNQPISRTDEPNAYKKCTTADGHTLFGDVPTGVICLKEENITIATSLAPADLAQQVNPSGMNMPDPTGPHLNGSPTNRSFVCDGRSYCSQMRSCDEAKYFLSHCPNMEMDGNNDGIPCQQQWCQ